VSEEVAKQAEQKTPRPLILGILSILLSPAFIGILFGVPGIIQGNEYLKKSSPETSIYKLAVIGRICSMLGIVLSIVSVVFLSPYYEIIYNPLALLPQMPLEELVEIVNDWLLATFGGITRAIAQVVRDFMSSFTDLLLWFPPFVFAVLLSLLAWRMSSFSVAVFTFVGSSLIFNWGYWEASLSTLTLILVSVFISIVIGLPVGILSTRSDLVHRIVWPVLDFMQTMPAFVYLIPAVFFFRTGTASAMIAVVVFSMPPVIRLTGLGIRQVSKEVVEAATAFGSTDWQKLVKVQLPLAKPTIMAGINQCIMLALSMVVIAAMIGAGGLGAAVLRGIQRLDIGVGFVSGLGVVILAIILDRITQSTKKESAEE